MDGFGTQTRAMQHPALFQLAYAQRMQLISKQRGKKVGARVHGSCNTKKKSPSPSWRLPPSLPCSPAAACSRKKSKHKVKERRRARSIFIHSWVGREIFLGRRDGPTAHARARRPARPAATAARRDAEVDWRGGSCAAHGLARPAPARYHYQTTGRLAFCNQPMRNLCISRSA